MKLAGSVATLGLLSGLLLALAWSLGSPVSLPDFSTLREGYRASDGVLLDRRGEVIHEVRLDRRIRRLEWTPLDETSAALRRAVLEAEDQRFYQHAGVDWKALAAGGWQTLVSRGSRGSSTITMQLVSLLVRELQPQEERRTLMQKWLQIRAARALERRWSKEQILEAYLNLVHFRGELQGIRAASRGLFGKQPHGLTDVESVVLASLLRAPNAGATDVTVRAVRLAARLGLLPSPQEVEAVARRALGARYRIEPQAGLAPHVASRLLPAGAPLPHGPRIAHSTLEGRLQRWASEVLQEHLQYLASSNVQDGAVLVVENETGEVLAYLGNGGTFSSARYVDGIQALRQAGSTLKPFLYGLAFQERLLTPLSLLEDRPLEIPVPGGLYRPENYDNRFRGPVTARVALASSLNIPAVRTLNLVGIEKYLRLLEDLGFRRLRGADFYGPSLALGSADVTLWDLVNAYRTLANEGRYRPLRMAPREEPGLERQVLSPQAAFLVSQVLSDREGRSVTFDLESPLATRFWTAVKTGTSKEMRDNWCVGYSSDYTVGVWVGNFSGAPMWNVSGLSGAAPVWVEIMNWLHRSRSSHPPAPPPGVDSFWVEGTRLSGPRKEWFLQGTEVRRLEKAVSRRLSRIRYPLQGTLIALDPDIPEGRQRLLLEVDGDGAGLTWVLDGKTLGPASSPVSWPPQVGPHTLSLLDETGRTLDTVEFSVRGAAHVPAQEPGVVEERTAEVSSR